MPKYMLQASYTAEGVKGLIKDTASGRRSAVKAGVKAVGGKLESMHYCFGKDDVVVIMDLPDNIAAASLVTAVGASGLVRARTTPLLIRRGNGQGAREESGIQGSRFRQVRLASKYHRCRNDIRWRAVRSLVLLGSSPTLSPSSVRIRRHAGAIHLLIG